MQTTTKQECSLTCRDLTQYFIAASIESLISSSPDKYNIIFYYAVSDVTWSHMTMLQVEDKILITW